MARKLHHFFTDDRMVLVMIILNAIVLLVLSFRWDADTRMFIEILDMLFLIYFLVEAALKIRLFGWPGYIASAWNRFDFFIVLVSIPSVFSIFEGTFSEGSIFFLFRIARVARFFKFFRFIPNIQELLSGIRRAFKASIFVLLAFFIYGFVVSLVSCRLFHQLSPELFGEPISAFYNIFKVFTIEGWYEVPETIIRQGGLSPTWGFLTKLYFILIVGTGGLFGLSIVNAIFVEEMVRDNNDELEARVKQMDAKLDQLLARSSSPSQQE